MSVFDEEKIDRHCHVFDPIRFPYRDDTAYRPTRNYVGKSSGTRRAACSDSTGRSTAGMLRSSRMSGICRRVCCATGAGRERPIFWRG
jgi:hypothetical protein